MILWLCENRDCFSNAIEEETPHKSYRRKRALLDNGRLDDDDELVVFSKLINPRANVECNDCGSLRQPILSINRFSSDDPPGNAGDDEWCETIDHAVAVYKRNGWWPNLQRRLY
jgi:hypothetical protein